MCIGFQKVEGTTLAMSVMFIIWVLEGRSLPFSLQLQASQRVENLRPHEPQVRTYTGLMYRSLIRNAFFAS